MEVFNECKIINKLIENDNDNEARNSLIKLLDYLKKNEVEYTPIINNLIRQTGLYPYINLDNANWNDKLVYDMFKVNTGENKPITLHREQSSLLKKLLSDKDIAVSAPTSFGKSFVIDAFIAIKKPKNIMIIVPTIALTDETRRRLQKKFSNDYKIITTTDVKIEEKNIFIFPQERAISYLNTIDNLDMLVVDEFYKASSKLDKERSSVLLKSIVKLSEIAKQRYFLAPNIKNIKDNPFTKGMDFVHIDFNTVVLEKIELYNQISSDIEKNNHLLNILSTDVSKSLIYAGTYKEILKVSELLLNNIIENPIDKLSSFSKWLESNYSKNWILSKLVLNGIGVHNGQLHRSLSQIQVKLFEEEYGLNHFITTSSIVEGVNTSTAKVIIWKSKNGQFNLNNFMYKNIQGRAGRMFKHFIGKVYVLDKPPKEEDIELVIDIPKDDLADFEDELKDSFSNEQLYKIIEYKNKMQEILGKENYNKLIKENVFKNNLEIIKRIAIDMFDNPTNWNGIAHLNSDNTDKWETSLYKIIKFISLRWGPHKRFVGFTKVLYLNASKTIPELLDDLKENNISINIDEFFELEKKVTFQLSSLVSDVNILQKIILKNKTELSNFVSLTSHAFLPSVVYLLEEYGLPRMLAKKIHRAKIINFNNKELDIDSTLDYFRKIGLTYIKENVVEFDEFDIYILEYFYDGISND